jgi:hypothetical protein
VDIAPGAQIENVSKVISHLREGFEGVFRATNVGDDPA